MKRTASIAHDEDFTYTGEICKAWTDKKTGARYLRGVASGVAEDRDGERVSARAIAKMASTPLRGGVVKATASHEQDWLTEFGDVVALQHDAAHDELLLDVRLPPHGEDPIADKAWTRSQTEKLGWSIGGKLRSSFFELVGSDGVGKAGGVRRRRVLDDIALRHVMLTKQPSYRDSFAEAIAKTAKVDDEPRFENADFFDEPDAQEDHDALEIMKRAVAEREVVLKAAKQDPDRPEDDADPDDPAAGNADDAAAAADADPDDPDAPTTAAAGGTTPDGDDAPSDAEAAADLPQGKGQRHLACPQCGTEFAAPLPDDVAGDDAIDQPSAESKIDTAKTHDPPGDPHSMTSSFTDTLDRLRGLAGTATVAKTTDTAPAPEPAPEPAAATDAPVVAKAVTDASDVEKMVAVSHMELDGKVDLLGDEVAKAFESFGGKLTALTEAVASIPQGRRSLVRSGGDGLAKPGAGDDVAKTVRAAVDSGAKALTDLTGEELQALPVAVIVEKSTTVTQANTLLNKRRGIE